MLDAHQNRAHHSVRQARRMSVHCSFAVLREPACSVARFGDLIHQLPDGNLVLVEQDRRLAAWEVHFHLAHTRLRGECLLDRLLTTMTMHTLDFDDGKLIM